MAKTKTPQDNISVPVRMPAELAELITSTSTEIKLSKQDTIRLSIERGLPILKKLLMMPAEEQLAA